MISKKINNQTKRKINKQRLATFVIGGIVSLMLIVGVVGLIVLFTFASGRPEVTATDFDSNQSSQIYDQNGELIGDVGETIRTNITYDELPTALIDAFVSVEDSRYFEHNGFDIPRFTKAIFNNLKSMSFSEGGSTFTMQLVDNTYFMEAAYTASKVEQVEYKVQEIFLSMETEEILSKERILELYLNKINFGGTGNIRGISKAAEYYFAKDVSELNLAESAMLAGIVNAPYTYDPFNFLDYATERRDTVLYLMYYHGYIDETEYQLATSIKVEDLLVDPNSTTGDGVGTAYQAYIDVVIEEVKEKTGYDPVYTPMKIYTYMDQDVQSVMDTIQAGEYDDITFPDDLIELASVSINNKTGAVNAIAGGRNYANGGSLLLNHATQQFKQPGSTVKPFLSYALAFELLGWSTSHTVTDQPIVYTGTDIVVSNATNTYNGQVTLGYAVGNSLNTPAIQTLEEVIANTSVSYVVEYLNSLGFDRVTEDNFSMGYAIGGAEFEVSVMELAGAMSAMLNGGVYNEPHTVYKVELMNTGEVIELDYTSTQVVSEETAFLVSELMYDNVYGSYYNYMQILKEDYAVYAKTGTTDYGSEAEAYGIAEGSAKDIWMVGGTSEYTVATWYGYEKAIAGEDTWISSEKNTPNIRGKITNAVLDANHVDSTPEDIVQPDNVVSITHILGVYPYTSPIEGMDEAYITTGLINKDFFQLQDPLSATVSDLTDFTVSVSSSGDVDIDFGTYPDESKLSLASTTIDLSITVDGTYIEAIGARIFDWSWVYGPIRYRGYIKVNGSVVHEFMSDSTHIDYSISGLSPGDSINVCGLYMYEYISIASNEVCKDFSVADNEVSYTFPSTSATKEEIVSWASSSGISVTYQTVRDNSLSGTNSMTISSTAVNSTTVTKLQSAWLSTSVVATIYIDECGENSSDVNGACVCNDGYQDNDDNTGCVIIPTASPDPDPEVDENEDTNPEADTSTSPDTTE